MRIRGTLLVLVSAAAVLVYGACSTTRLGPISGAGADAEPTPDDPDDPDDPDGSSSKDASTRADAKSPDAKTDAPVSDWPCPAPSDAGTLDREWVTGPIAPSSPGAANYALRTASVCDRTTLLEWERAVSATTRTWTEANAYCDSLLLEGTSDWRLPTRIELLTIVDFTRMEPAIDPVVFPSTPSDAFWSSTLMFGVFNDPNAYLVVFDRGHAAPFTKSEPLHVRCVRGGR